MIYQKMEIFEEERWLKKIDITIEYILSKFLYTDSLSPHLAFFSYLIICRVFIIQTRNKNGAQQR